MKKNGHTPPFFSRKLINILLDRLEHETLLGDLSEMYEQRFIARGRFHADMWFRLQMVKLLPQALLSYLFRRNLMFKNYTKIAFRNLLKHKAFSLINLFGLSIGMACCILIMLWVNDEISYDKFHNKSDRIYRVIQEIYFSDHTTLWGITQGPLGPAMKEELAEVETYSRYSGAGWWIRNGDELQVENGCFADQGLFDIFSFKVIEGDQSTALVDPKSIVLTKSMADRYFENGNSIGNTINLNNQYDLKVTAVIEDIPDNSTLQFDYIIPFVFTKRIGFSVERWNNSGFATFILLTKDVNVPAFQAKIRDFLIEKPTVEDKQAVLIQPLTDIYLKSNIEYDLGGLGDIKYVYIFSITAFLILCIACINFMNLTTARSGGRAKEVGLRKVVGAKRKELMAQFFGESILITLISFTLSLGIVALIINQFGNLSGKDFQFNNLFESNLIISIGLIAIITGVISGSYPALMMSSFTPVAVLKGSFKTSAKGASLRKGLVIFQFTLSIVLIVCSLLINDQLKFLSNAKLGYNKDNIIVATLRGGLMGKYETVRTELMNNPDIINVSSVASLPTQGFTFSNSMWEWDGKNAEDDILFRANFVNYDYFETLKMDFVLGRGFSREFRSDSMAVVINEAAAKVMSMDEPVGQILRVGSTGFNIIGVVKDHNFRSLRSIIEPLILISNQNNTTSSLIAVKSSNMPEVIKHIEKTFKTMEPAFPFSYTFLDDRLNNLYGNEKRIGTIFNYATILAIIISCLGLFGLAAFTAEQRNKEIGIRKTLGASVPGIIALISKEFLKLVFIGNIIAWPVAWIYMGKWLGTFAYSTDINLLMFLYAGLIAFLVSLLTVIWQAFKAAKTDPVVTLKYE